MFFNVYFLCTLSRHKLNKIVKPVNNPHLPNFTLEPYFCKRKTAHSTVIKYYLDLKMFQNANRFIDLKISDLQKYRSFPSQSDIPEIGMPYEARITMSIYLTWLSGHPCTITQTICNSTGLSFNSFTLTDPHGQVASN